jgi:sterol desaturase/sphingolipid hydroxylase (fatty acid hydroxylase superfamily)
MRVFIARHFYALAVGGSLLAFLIAREFGFPPEAVLLGSSVVLLAVTAALERVMPFNAAWNQRVDNDTPTDATSAAFLIGVADPALNAVMPVLALALLSALGQPQPLPLVPSDTPFVAQVLLALLWIEFAKYWSHRWHHSAASLWWLHALHHSSRRLYWLNNFRFHPLNHAINLTLSLLPLWLLGVPIDVLLATTAITQPVVLLQHANLDLRSGFLNRVFSTNELHRWHHSNRPQEANANFGSALVLWDQVFGTYRYEPGRNAPASLGLFGNGGVYPAAQSYLRQLASMFGGACCKA